MNRSLLLMSWLLLHGGLGQAAELSMNAATQERLGVRTEPLIASERRNSIGAQALVAVPPESDHLIGVSQEGVVARLWVSPGERVHAGQPVAEVSSPEFLMTQSEYLAALGASRVATAQLARDAELEAEGIISRRRLQEARAVAEAAEAERDEQRQRLLLAGLTDADLKRLGDGRRLLPSLEIRAPVDGVALAQLAQVGDAVGPLAPVYRIADLSSLNLDIQVPWDRLAEIRPGMPVAIARQGGESVLAEVRSIGALVDARTQNARVLARTTVAGHGLLPGQILTVSIIVPADPTHAIWQVPAVALVRHGDRSHLFVQSAEGFQVRVVEVSGSSGERMLCSGPLSASDRIAVSGLASLKSLWLETAEEP